MPNLSAQKLLEFIAREKEQISARLSANRRGVEFGDSGTPQETVIKISREAKQIAGERGLTTAYNRAQTGAHEIHFITRSAEMRRRR
ncbi:MAG: hypothetical protein V1722_04595 [Candidatus Micrarchaeota archaeon]